MIQKQCVATIGCMLFVAVSCTGCGVGAFLSGSADETLYRVHTEDGVREMRLARYLRRDFLAAAKESVMYIKDDEVFINEYARNIKSDRSRYVFRATKRTTPFDVFIQAVRDAQGVTVQALYDVDLDVRQWLVSIDPFVLAITDLSRLERAAILPVVPDQGNTDNYVAYKWWYTDRVEPVAAEGMDDVPVHRLFVEQRDRRTPRVVEFDTPRTLGEVFAQRLWAE